MKRNYKIRLVVFFIINSILFVSCKSSDKGLGGDKSYGNEDFYTIKESEISKYIIANGIVQGENEVVVTHSPIASVDMIYVKVGDYVNEGDLLFSYKKSDIQTQIDELNKEYEELKSRQEYTDDKNERNYQEAVAEKEKKTANAQKDIDDAQDEYDKLIIKYNDAINECFNIEKNMSDNKNDLDELAIYEEQYLQKKAEIKELEQSVSESEKTIELAKEQYELIVYEMQKNVEAMIDVINDEKYNNELSDLEKQIADKKSIIENVDICATVSGVITELYIEQGVTHMDERTVVISNCDRLSVILDVNEEDIKSVEKNMTVEIYIGKKVDMVTGKVTRISHVNNEASSTYSVEVCIENDNMEKTFLGMGVTAKIYTEVRENAISIPYECISIDEEEKTYVVRIKEDNKSTEKILVTTGIENSNSIEIISDIIKEGDRIIINK
ncbi:MAG: efflux RND transporter periplasmic adaptor subunit [Lachnospiraceae bacterium]|nr:efflux RND transporter periplasmic adaptor subunit [Lachnospiraceae bacterium]